MARKPIKSFNQVNQDALKALELAERHQAVLEPRLPSGLIDGLRGDLEQLGALVPKVRVIQSEKVGKTAGQAAALRQGHQFIVATRTAVQKNTSAPEVRRAYGVGRNVDPRVVKSVSAGLQQIIGRATEQPEEARSLGLLSSDLEAMRQALAAIGGADTQQEKARAHAPLTTKARNVTARRVVDAVDRLGSAGILAYVSNPAERAPFEALLTRGPARKRKPAAPTA